MKEIRNTTTGPIRVSLPGGKILHLGPGNVAQIADNAVEHGGVARLVEAGTIEIMGDGDRADGPSAAGSPHAQPQDRGKSPFRRKQGER